MVLALIAERTSGNAFHELVRRQVLAPAGMVDTVFLRSDELPGAGRGRLPDRRRARTNVFHIPVRGNGDGGIYSTLADIHALWAAFFGASIVSGLG